MVKFRHLGRVLLGLVALFAVCVTPTKAKTVSVIFDVGKALSNTSIPESFDASKYYILRRSPYGTGASKVIKSDLTLGTFTKGLTISAIGSYDYVVTIEGNANEGYSFKFVSTGKYLTLRGDNTVDTSDWITNDEKFTINAFIGESDGGTTGDTYVAIFGFVNSGNTLSSEENKICGQAYYDGDQAAYEIVPVAIGEVTDVVDVTYNLVDKAGKTITSETVWQTIGDSIALPSAWQRDYCTYTLSESNVSENTTSVTVTVTYDLPFTVSTTIDDNANWYKMVIRGSKTCFYDATTNTVECKSSLDTTITCQMFAFTGDPINGFHIYNYAAGANKVLWSSSVSDSDTIKFVDLSSATSGLWKLCQNGTAGSVFLKDGSDNGYINDFGQGGIIAYWANASAATDNGSTITFTDVVDVTYNVVDKAGKTITSETVWQTIGDSIALPSAWQRDYCTYEFPKSKVSENTTSVTVTVTYDLPFTVSTTIDDNANWYKMVIRGSKTCSYNATTNEIECKRSPDFTSANDLFAFTGDPINGFYIYNYEAGTNKVLWSSSVSNGTAINFVDLSSATSGLWKLCQNGTAGSVFLKDGSDNGYINDYYMDGVISYWVNASAANDNGSTITFTAYDIANLAQDKVNSIAKNAKDKYDANNTLSSSYLSVVTEVLGLTLGVTVDAAYTTFVNDKTEANAQAYAEAVEENPYISEEIAAQLAHKYYRIQSYSTAGAYIGYEDDNISNAHVDTSADLKKVKYIWQFTPCEDGFKLKNANSGKYLNAAETETSNTTTFSDTYENGAKYVLDASSISSNGKYLYYNIIDENEGNLNGYGYKYEESFWIIEEADTLEVDLNTLGDKGYATAYLPFGVSDITGATAYVDGQYDADDATKLVMEEASDVAAQQGFVLVGKAGGTAKLTINDDATTTSSVLTGTLTGTDNSDSYLVFGKGHTSGKAGFYKYAGFTIPANKAYIDNSTQQAVQLAFGSTTGINATTVIDGSSENNAPVYDLSGRRVSKATRGLYIQGGKKYLAR